MRVIRWMAAGVAVAVGVVYGMGARLPAEHRTIASGVVRAPLDRVWTLVSDTATQTQWRVGIPKLGVIPDRGYSDRCWLEQSRSGSLSLCLVREIPKKLRVVQTADPGAFSATWTYTLAPVGADATQVTITQDGRVGPPTWRFIGHYLAGDRTNVKVFLEELQDEAVRRQ